MRPVEWGVATLIPGFGQLIDQVQAPLTRLFDVRDGEIRMNDRVRFPAKPMVGVVGVATGGEEALERARRAARRQPRRSLPRQGSAHLLPGAPAGGMFAVGDMHASMGDGEICFTGVEIAGEVDIRFHLLKGKQATWPVTELADRCCPMRRPPTTPTRCSSCRRRPRGSSSTTRVHDRGCVHLPLGRLRRRRRPGV